MGRDYNSKPNVAAGSCDFRKIEMKSRSVWKDGC